MVWRVERHGELWLFYLRVGGVLDGILLGLLVGRGATCWIFHGVWLGIHIAAYFNLVTVKFLDNRVDINLDGISHRLSNNPSRSTFLILSDHLPSLLNLIFHSPYSLNPRPFLTLAPFFLSRVTVQQPYQPLNVCVLFVLSHHLPITHHLVLAFMEGLVVHLLRVQLLGQDLVKVVGISCGGVVPEKGRGYSWIYVGGTFLLLPLIGNIIFSSWHTISLLMLFLLLIQALFHRERIANRFRFRFVLIKQQVLILLIQVLFVYLSLLSVFLRFHCWIRSASVLRVNSNPVTLHLLGLSKPVVHSVTSWI